MSLTGRLKAFAVSAVQRAGGLMSVPGSGVAQWLYGGSTGLPHEPFAGAWQRNLDSVGAAGPNILAHSGVYSCVSVISSDIARMPVRILKERKAGGYEEFDKHPYSRLFEVPNGFQNSLQFIQQYLTSKLIHGNTYVLLMRDLRGVVSEMYVLDPTRVTPLIATDGSIFYQLAMNELAGLSGPATVPSRNIVHDRMATFWHPLVGVSPLFAAGVSAMTGARILMNSEKFFANMSRAGGLITGPGKIDPAVAKRLQNEWEENYGPRGLGRTAVLSNGLDFKPLTINAVDAELVNQLRWTIEDVARVYRVPLYKLADQTKMNYRNGEQMARDYFQGCLSYHIEAFEQCMERSLELGSGIEVEFDLRPMFRMETDTRYDTYQKALNAGFMSINEVRAEEDLPPVKGGEEPRVQVQYVPLSLATGIGVSNPAAPAPADTTPAPAPADTPDTPAPVSTTPEEAAASDKVQPGLFDDDDLQTLTRAFIRRVTGAQDGS